MPLLTLSIQSPLPLKQCEHDIIVSYEMLPVIEPPPINHKILIILDIPLSIVHDPKTLSDINTLNNLLPHKLLSLL